MVIFLSQIPLGGRLLYRARDDWRVAVVSTITDEMVTISVSSPKGRNYRIRREPNSEVMGRSGIWFLDSELKDGWRENCATYDMRW